jgi:hypothetical protein
MLPWSGNRLDFGKELMPLVRRPKMARNRGIVRGIPLINNLSASSAFRARETWRRGFWMAGPGDKTAASLLDSMGKIP